MRCGGAVAPNGACLKAAIGGARALRELTIPPMFIDAVFTAAVGAKDMLLRRLINLARRQRLSDFDGLVGCRSGYSTRDASSTG